MVTIEEIRIGNWFIGYDDKPFQWKLAHFHTLFHDGINVDEIIKSRILLNLEWFENFGFDIKKTPNGNKYIQFDSIIVYLPFCLSCSVNYAYSDTHYPHLNIKLQYVHEFQNLYYTFNKIELQTKK